MLKKIRSGKISGTKNALFLLLQAPTDRSFTFNLRFLSELKHQVCLSETASGISHFCFLFVFIKISIFVQENAWVVYNMGVLGQFCSLVYFWTWRH